VHGPAGHSRRLSVFDMRRWLVVAISLAIMTYERGAEAGIHGLGPLLAKEAPASSSERTLQDFSGKKLAIDASMAMYQFLIAVRVAGRDGVSHTLTNEAGDDTSHLQGSFWRTIAMLRVSIKPLYVFDGKAPELKSGEIDKRNERRALVPVHPRDYQGGARERLGCVYSCVRVRACMYTHSRPCARAFVCAIRRLTEDRASPYLPLYPDATHRCCLTCWERPEIFDVKKLSCLLVYEIAHKINNCPALYQRVPVRRVWVVVGGGSGRGVGRGGGA
jgi:hypothetical protein